MSIRHYLSFGAAGWLAGVTVTLALSICILAALPGLIPLGRQADSLLGLPTVVVFLLQIASLPALVGGLLGGRIPVEGGPRDQLRMAAVCGVLASLPFSCFVLWSLAGR